MMNRSLRCAIIDDDPADILLLKTFIQKATSGLWRFEEYHDYDSGASALATGSPDIAFIDLDINGRDGRDLIRHAVARNAGYPIVVVSALSDDDLQEAAISAGAYDYLPKDDIDEKTIKRMLRHVFAAFRKEQELKRMAEKAHHGNAVKSTFLASISHDLRTPLNAIIGFADVLHTNALGPNTHMRTEEYTGLIGESARHLLDVINTILDLSKIEEGKLVLSRKWIDPGEFIAEQVRALAPVSGARSISVDTQMRHRGHMLLADERSLRQIFINIFSNAVKFSEPDGRIRVSTALHDDGLTIAVSDSGIGMTVLEAKQALAPFSQVTQNPELARQGTGLGLAIVKGLTEAHGAELKIDSRKGIGTRVSVTFPTASVSKPKETGRRGVRTSAA